MFSLLAVDDGDLVRFIVGVPMSLRGLGKVGTVEHGRYRWGSEYPTSRPYHPYSTPTYPSASCYPRRLLWACSSVIDIIRQSIHKMLWGWRSTGLMGGFLICYFLQLILLFYKHQLTCLVGIGLWFLSLVLLLQWDTWMLAAISRFLIWPAAFREASIGAPLVIVARFTHASSIFLFFIFSNLIQNIISRLFGLL